MDYELLNLPLLQDEDEDIGTDDDKEDGAEKMGEEGEDKDESDEGEDSANW
jgi:hypothetical protein